MLVVTFNKKLNHLVGGENSLANGFYLKHIYDGQYEVAVSYGTQKWYIRFDLPAGEKFKCFCLSQYYRFFNPITDIAIFLSAVRIYDGL